MGSNEAAHKVKETLKLFRKTFNDLSNEQKREPKGKDEPMIRRFDLKAAKKLKEEGKFINQEKCLGPIPGIQIGDRFRYRAELCVVGMHHKYVAGIDYMLLKGKELATCVVNSGRYANKAKTPDVLIYCGEGGIDKQGKILDQELKLGNTALVNSCEAKTQIRMIRKTENRNGFSEFVYDGLYRVNKHWTERDGEKFELHRILRQSGGGGLSKNENCVVSDVSHGRERFPVKAMNGIDCKKPGHFKYVIKTEYLDWCEKKEPGGGCCCTDGCSDSGGCVCVSRNEGGIGYECGPSCKCPDSCPNRVSQCGARYKLELFKAESNRWGVRSRSFIQSGSFVCEYVGKVQQIEEASVRKALHDDTGELFRFPIPKSKNHRRSDENGMMFVVDASKDGNVGRFIRHSKSPSLVVRSVLYDHGDVRMPHILFFAAKNIPPLRELTCDYEHYRMME